MGDLVWEDLNVNGIQDPGEPGIAGVTVNIYSCDGNLVDTTVTDAVGNYNFIAEEGDYFVEFEAPVGYVFTPQDQGADDAMDSDADATTGQTVCTILDPEEIDYTWDAGMHQLASIGDFVWEDLNANGIQEENETGIDGVTVELYDSANNLLATTVTYSNGFYQFTGLTPGEYSIGFVPPAGYFFSPQDQGADDTIDSDADITTGRTDPGVIGSGEVDNTWDAGLYQPASIGDFVWEDLNVNGIQDAGEQGFSGATVQFYDCYGNLLAMTITDGTGFYQFSGITPGEYYVEFILPPGYFFSPQDQGTDDSTDSDADIASGLTTCIFLGSGVDYQGRDAGVTSIQWGGIGNLAWNDLNNDGIQDTNESGIPNVTVELYDCESNHLATTITDSNGTYQFIGLESGNYSVGFVLPAGYIFSLQDQGTDDTADSDADPATGLTTCIEVNPGEIDMTLDAGFLEIMPGIDVEKFTNGLDEDTDSLTGIVIGDTVTWKYIITNTGNVPLGNIVLTDDKQGIIPCPKNTLSPGESMECEMDDVAEYGHYVNTANVTAQFDGFVVSDEDVGEYYGYEPGDSGWEPNAVPTAGPIITALLLGVFMVLLLKRDKKQ
ncbi:SdrD B-like domain-containing protein [uncultured Methanolobus sp.]|uniref:SdrD B-like domain-containing protein n=1 Tax=uncultured Methanolobus sp. TaxID=218300 RepID=UPI0029C7C102|nr:SdrD B-like domain-containing protein [uncultured Methanolobus sp.]